MRAVSLVALTLIAQMALSLIAPAALAGEQSSVRSEFNSLLDEFEQQGGARIFARRFLKLAGEHPRDPASFQALMWVVKHVRGKSDTERALKLLAQHHVESGKLGAACKEVAMSRSVGAEQLLRATIDKNPDRHVRAQAAYHLTTLLDREADIVSQLKAEPQLAPRVLQYYGPSYGKHLSAIQPATLEEQREQAYQQLLDAYANVEIRGKPLGEIAEKALFRIRHLSIGKVAPDVEGHDIHGDSMKLSDYRGKVVMLMFWGHW